MDYLSGWCKSKRRLDGYTAIITGSNTGIGKETTLDFYLRGARVIMACRDTNKGEEAKREIEKSHEMVKGIGSLKVDKLDLCSFKSVREFAFRVLKSEPTIQILVNNAGVMMCPESRTEDGFETHIGSNHLGHALLTLLLLPRMIKSAPSRIVCVSSRIHVFYKLDFKDINYETTPYTPLAAYARSKVANVLFAKALTLKFKELDINGVSTYSLHPGIVKTGIGRHFKQTAWSIITYGFQNVFLKYCWKSPKCGAQTNIFCAVDEACANQSGLYYSDCSVSSPSRQCRNNINATKLWDITIELLKLQNYNPFGDADPTEDMFTNNR